MKSQWIIYDEDKNLQDSISKKFKISNITSQILINRGLTEPEVIKKFFNITLQSLTFPLLLKNLEQACDRIIYAFKKQQKIVIYGDYDVDGITSVSLLYSFFKLIGASENILFYIPSRLSEGYGLNIDAIKKFKSENIKLIITVDCGISNIAEIEFAKSLGIDVIVTDHHEVPEDVPPAFAIVDPKQKDCNFPFKDLAGVGIAFYLLIGLRMKLRDSNFWKNKDELNLKNFLDLVALGTIADICPLKFDNRILVKFGLSELERSNRMGVKALKQICGIREGQLNYWNVGFRLAPRINAIGRLDNATLGVNLLTTDSYSDALKIASLLERNNYKRQKIEEKILNEALSIMEKSKNFKNKQSIVLYSENWHEGVIGIVSSRLVEKYYKPTILISFKDDIGKGSARSIKNFDIYEALNLCSEFLESFGGHKYAAGITLKKEKLHDFIDAFEYTVKKLTRKEDFYKKYLLIKKSLFQILETL
jgi:single-stranded-DNA-specific exonuclease